jgi:hypothetical protein
VKVKRWRKYIKDLNSSEFKAVGMFLQEMKAKVKEKIEMWKINTRYLTNTPRSNPTKLHFILVFSKSQE